MGSVYLRMHSSVWDLSWRIVFDRSFFSGIVGCLVLVGLDLNLRDRRIGDGRNGL